MEKNYELLKIEIVLSKEEPIRTSPNYGGDSDDDWGTDIWD